MILSDGDLERALDQDDLVVEPLEDREQQIQPASIDVRLGQEFMWLPDVDVIRPETDLSSGATREVAFGDELVLNPGEFVLGTTVEWVEIPADLKGQLEGRSSIGRMAIEVHSTAGVLDPGYRGEITLEIKNKAERKVALVPGMRVGQLLFEYMMTPAERPYGSDRGSHYQGQEGPTASRIGSDQDLVGDEVGDSRLG